MFILNIFLFSFLPLVFPLKCGFVSYDGCLQCKSDSSGCQLCEAFNDTLSTQGYAYSNLTKSCIQCLIDGSQALLPGCSKCDGLNKCNSTGCVIGFLFSQDSCVPCAASQNCLNCLNATFCVACTDQYYLDKGSCISCAKISPGCQECTNSGCTICGMGYNLNANGGCNPCLDKNCTICDSSSCQTCIMGYYPVNQQCLQCSVTNCAVCPLDNCESCIVPYALNDTFWPLTCIECSLNTTLLTPGCSNCEYDPDSQQFVCNVCADGYYLNNNNCTVCPVNCLTCINSTQCLSCIIPYILVEVTQSIYDCEKICDTSMNQNILINGVCYSCSAYYSGNCTKCDNLHCLQCANPTPYLRPPWNVSCESCDLAGVDLPQSTAPLVCYSNTTAFISSIVPNSDNVFSISLTCQVPSTIYIVLALEWGSDEDSQVINWITLDDVQNQTGNHSQVWIDRNINDPYWTVYGMVNTDSLGNYYGTVNASIKLSGDIYDVEIWCVSDSGGVISDPTSKQFYPEYNYGYSSAITISVNKILTSSNKTFIGKALYNMLNLSSAFRVLYTDEGVAINTTNSNSRRFLSSNSTNTTTNSSNQTNPSIVYQYLFYSPPNWTLNSDAYDLVISNLIANNSFLGELNTAVKSLNVIISAISAESTEEQGDPSFSVTTPTIINMNDSLQFTVQVNQVNGYLLVGVAESEPFINGTNGTMIFSPFTTLDQRMPTWDNFTLKVNMMGTPFIDYQRIYTINGNTNVLTIGNLTPNTTYDIYFAATNSDFPFLMTTDIYGVWTFTMVNVFGERLGILWVLVLGLTYLVICLNY